MQCNITMCINTSTINIAIQEKKHKKTLFAIDSRKSKQISLSISVSVRFIRSSCIVIMSAARRGG